MAFSGDIALLSLIWGVGVMQWQEHLPLTNVTRVQLPAWEVCELGLWSLSEIGGFLRVLWFPPPTKNSYLRQHLSSFRINFAI